MKKILSTVLILVLSFGLTAIASVVIGFTDESTFDSWYKTAAETMRTNGIMNGYEDGSFGPANPVKRAELAVILKQFARVMGKPLPEEPVMCNENLAFPGLIIYLQDQGGFPIEKAQISAQHWEGLVSDTSFTEPQPGVYYGLGEEEGYYTFKIQKDTYAPHTETVKLEKTPDGCAVFTQTRTITLVPFPTP